MSDPRTGPLWSDLPASPIDMEAVERFSREIAEKGHAVSIRVLPKELKRNRIQTMHVRVDGAVTYILGLINIPNVMSRTPTASGIPEFTEPTQEPAWVKLAHASPSQHNNTGIPFYETTGESSRYTSQRQLTDEFNRTMVGVKAAKVGDRVDVETPWKQYTPDPNDISRVTQDTSVQTVTDPTTLPDVTDDTLTINSDEKLEQAINLVEIGDNLNVDDFRKKMLQYNPNNNRE